MRAFILAGAAAGFVVLCGLVIAGGNALDEPSFVIDEADLPTDIPGGEDAIGVNEATEEPAASEATKTIEPDRTSGEQTAETTDQKTGLVRATPREPLSTLSQALPPGRKKAVSPEDWKSTRLFNPVAASAGVIEAQGHQVALAGIQPTLPDEECTYEGTTWPCGTQARTAFRAWLRARAVQCVVPPDPDRQLITADCNVGKQDLGEWLVSNGWARAAEGGPYAEAEAKARDRKLGIFGHPPSKAGLPAVRPNIPLGATLIEPPPAQILVPDSEPAIEETTGATPPIDLTAPFPPAPASP